MRIFVCRYHTLLYYFRVPTRIKYVRGLLLFSPCSPLHLQLIHPDAFASVYLLLPVSRWAEIILWTHKPLQLRLTHAALSSLYKSHMLVRV